MTLSPKHILYCHCYSEGTCSVLLFPIFCFGAANRKQQVLFTRSVLGSHKGLSLTLSLSCYTISLALETQLLHQTLKTLPHGLKLRLGREGGSPAAKVHQHAKRRTPINGTAVASGQTVVSPSVSWSGHGTHPEGREFGRWAAQRRASGGGFSLQMQIVCGTLREPESEA